ncbi:hypothetical protein DFP72DRAFT_512031 [Ephemerocybe angulata]|uniref:Uncharacterized protein n=1 Tax=Ephemerocybe angulata TaxID=980116 RepID=A0A8H6HQZ5_9AGAR|nr:hypothetical protein DFP72DRAFT_511972 [Tulosesus angulatus]KAF6750296.1 hypothetical protein DFP72DRAFT_512031 [Tulosesus angulatus]
MPKPVARFSGTIYIVFLTVRSSGVVSRREHPKRRTTGMQHRHLLTVDTSPLQTNGRVSICYGLPTSPLVTPPPSRHEPKPRASFTHMSTHQH